MSKKIIVTGITFIALSIVFGAMAAHALEKYIGHELIATFEKGVKYQLYMGLGLLAIGLNTDKIRFKLNVFYALICFGTLLFSGGIYIYVFHVLSPGLKNVVHIVPIGGMAMIVAWIILLVQFIRQK